MIIAPSLLAADFGRLRDEARRALRAGADWLHIDVMDGHFVPTISFGPECVRMLRPLTRHVLDVHLLCSQPENMLEPFAKAGADHLTVHVELGDRVLHLLWKIRSLGIQAGLALNPSTAPVAIEPYLKYIDQLLVLTVHPGYSGQAFIEEMVPKLQQISTWQRQKSLKFQLAVEGGLNPRTATECARAGANILISGTALFQPRNMRAALNKLRAAGLS